MTNQARGRNTTASVPASQAGYEGSTPFTRSKGILLWVLPPIFIAINRFLNCVGGIPPNTFKKNQFAIKLFGGRFPSLAPCTTRVYLQVVHALHRRSKATTGTGQTLGYMARPALLFFLLLLAGCKTASTPYGYNAVTTHVGGTYHYVKSGDTLWSISRLYDVDISALISANNLDDLHDIRRGQRLLIPGTSKKQEAPRPYFSKDSFSWPIKGNVVSYYGAKLDKTRNKGIDIHADEGAGVKASRAGKVVFCDEWLKGFGKTVILDHGDSFQTVYAYNSILLVKPGDLVEQNVVIAKAGRGGRAKEPSLHFEIRRNGEPQNPFYYLSH